MATRDKRTIERAISRQLSDVEAFDKSAELLADFGFSPCGPVHELRFRRGKTLSWLWALSPSMWPATAQMQRNESGWKLCLQVHPPGAPSRRELAYWESVADYAARALDGDSVEIPTGDDRKLVFVSLTIVSAVSVAVGFATWRFGVAWGAVLLATLLAIGFVISRLIENK
jgi:hypothetical protein